MCTSNLVLYPVQSFFRLIIKSQHILFSLIVKFIDKIVENFMYRVIYMCFLHRMLLFDRAT